MSELHQAVRDEAVERAKELITNGKDVDKTDIVLTFIICIEITVTMSASC